MKIKAALFGFVTAKTLTNDVNLTDDPAICAYNPDRDDFPGGSFPKDFRWSLATAAYQIEGGVNEGKKGKNIWDIWVHQKYPNDPTRCNVDNCDNADVACDSYNQMDRDLDNIISMGVKNYRFSLSWARILPNGTSKGGLNKEGIEHYNKWIDMLLANGITPFVTLYHWDLPQALQDNYQGWLGDQVVTDFGDYARTCYHLFGDRIKHWITLNEPHETADEGYGFGWMAPGMYGPNDKRWTARHNTVRAHAEAWHIYDKEFRSEQKGLVGITLNTDWVQPITDSDKDHQAAAAKNAFDLGYWADPIYKTGDYPQIVKDLLAKENAKLPSFTPDEIKKNLGSSDFFGVNHYTTSLVGWCQAGTDGCDWGYYQTRCSNWPTAGSSWLASNPYGIRRLMNYLDQEYNSTQYPIIVTENGISSKGNGTDEDPELNDHWRADFYHGYIGQLHRAVTEDKVNVFGYTAWSMMDNFEWARGFAERFGMMWTNFTDPHRAVYRKQSADFFTQVTSSNSVPSSKND